MLKYAPLTLSRDYNIEKGRRGRNVKIEDWKTHSFNETGLFRGVSRLLLSMIVGQTTRNLRSRTREHKRGIFTGVKNSLLAQHCIQNNHEFDLDDVKITDRCSQWSKRLFLEAWHSICVLKSTKEYIYIPHIYKALGNTMWRFPAALLKHFTWYGPFMLKRVKVFLTETFTQRHF